MVSPKSPILVFGAGSIGERHLGILQKLGYTNLWVYRQRNLPLRTVEAEALHIITDLSQFESTGSEAAAIICTPTAQHLEQTLWCLEKKIPVLVEKPLSHTLAGLSDLKQASLQNATGIQVAYMLRYHPFFQEIRAKIDQKELGSLLSAQTYWGEYLPDWHPWEDYRQSYAARRDLGGGAALTLSHDLDLVNWLAGSPVRSWSTLKNYRSALEIDVESGADVSLVYESGQTAHCHLNFHERAPRRWYRFTFENGSIEVDYLKSSCTVWRAGHEPVTSTLPDFDRNQLFEDQLRDFFQKINRGNFAAASAQVLLDSEIILKICT